MKKRKKWIFFVAPPAVVLLIAICGEVVMHLWNWLLPTLFACRQITFWQALGLLLLCRILFGGWGGGGSDRSRRGPRTAEQWGRMTPEERAKFHYCGGSAAPAGGTGEPA